MSLKDALQIVTNEAENNERALSVGSDGADDAKVVLDYDLKFAYNSTSKTYQPTWVFQMNNDKTYNVNCFDGVIAIQ